jgi:hypothetical protein
VTRIYEKISGDEAVTVRHGQTSVIVEYRPSYVDAPLTRIHLTLDEAAKLQKALERPK